MAVNTRVNGMPDSWGAKRAGVARISGPAVYAPYTAPSTGGQDVDVQPAFGIKTADFAVGGVSEDGLYEAKVVQIEAGPVLGQTVAGARLVLKWYVLATGVEAGAIDLSASVVRIWAFGDK